MPVIPGKNYEGQSGFPTPDDTPSETACRIFRVPADDQWLGLLMGAVELLLDENNWYSWGALTPADAAAAWALIVDRAYADSLVESCPTGTPAPFWDTATDADDEYPAGELTPWYGTATVTYHSPPDVTFVEKLFTWTFAGFMAISGAPGAALAFLTIAPRFIIAFKTGNLGGIVDIIVDSAHMATVDTYSVSEGVLELPVIADPDNDTHQIYIVKDDNPDTTVQVVRSELSPDAVSSPNTRVSGGVVQTTADGGTTWVDNPQADPRTNIASAINAAPTDNPQCDAATRMVAIVREALEKLYLAATAISAINGIFAMLVALVPGVGVIIDLVIGLVEALGLLTVAALETAFTDDVFNQLVCLFMARIGDDGLLTADAFTGLQEDVAAHFGAGVVNDAMSLFWSSFGLNTFNNASVKRTEIGDCTDCSPHWSKTWDFAVTDGAGDGWYPEASGLGTWVAGQGWTGQANGQGGLVVSMENDTAMGNLKEYAMVYTKTNGAFPNDVNHLDVYVSGVRVVRQGDNALGTGVGKFWNGSEDGVGTIVAQLNSGNTSASVYIERITLSGDGDCPFATCD